MGWGGNHQFNLLPATTGQDEVPRQGKILTTMMLLAVFSCLVLHIDWISWVCVHYLRSHSEAQEPAHQFTPSLMEGKAKQNNESHGDFFFFFFFFPCV